MEGRSDLTRTTLAVLFVAGLIAACFWILRPFLPAIIWATTLVVATWPVMLRVQHRLWNRRGLAVAIMTFALLLVFVVPFWLAITTIIENFDRIVEWGTSLKSFKLPPAPEWLAGVPLFGERAAQFWENIAATGVEPLVAKAAPYAGEAASWFVAALGGFGHRLRAVCADRRHRRHHVCRRRACRRRGPALRIIASRANAASNRSGWQARRSAV